MSDVRKIPNSNGKLDNPVFSHIALAPAGRIVFNGNPMPVMVGDEIRAPFKAYLVDMIRIKFGDVYSFLTYPAEGIPWNIWRKKFIEQYPQITDETEVAVYYFAKDFGSGPPEWSKWDEGSGQIRVVK